MKRYVVDASVAVKWAVPEPGYQLASQLLKVSTAQLTLFAPDLILSEVVQALRKKAENELSWEEVTQLAIWFTSMPVTLLPSGELIITAVAIAQRLKTTIYDALYLAAARLLEAPLVTDDRDLARSARRHGLAEFITELPQLVL